MYFNNYFNSFGNEYVGFIFQALLCLSFPQLLYFLSEEKEHFCLLS